MENLNNLIQAYNQRDKNNKPFAEALGQILAPSVHTALNNSTDGLVNGFNAVDKGLATMFGGLRDYVDNSVYSINNGIKNNIKKANNSIANNLTQNISYPIEDIKNTFYQIPSILSDAGKSIAKPNPDYTGVVNQAKKVLGGALQAPTQLPEIAATIGDAIVPDSLEDIAKNVWNQATLTQRDLDKLKETEAQQQQVSQQDLAVTLENRNNLLRELYGVQESEQPTVPNQVSLTPTQNPQTSQAVHFPAPPKGADYSSVQEALDKTKPTPDNVDYEKRTRDTVLMGIMGGLLQGAIRGEDLGTMFARAGVGGLTAKANVAKNREQAKQTFKKALNNYWIKTADVRKMQAESDADYAYRVYQSKLIQMKTKADSFKKSKPRIIQQNNRTYVIGQSPEGKMIMQELKPEGEIDRASKMFKVLTDVYGNSPKQKDKIRALIADGVQKNDPLYPVETLTLAELKATGKYIDLIKKLSNASEKFNADFNAIGLFADQTLGGVEADKDKLIDKRRDTLVREALGNNPKAMLYALDLLDIDDKTVRALYNGL